MSFRAKREIVVISDVLKWLKQGLFPVLCVGCGKEGIVVCDSCLASVPLLEPCRSVISIAHYSHPVVKGIIRGLKFSYTEEFRPALEQLVRRGAVKFDALLPQGSDVLVVPIPTTSNRFRARGFDHVEWIAQILACTKNVPYGTKLIHAREHAPQSHLVADEDRVSNISGAFRITGDVSGKRVILVDDVITSGATLNEATRALLAAGAREICAFTLARSK